MQKQYIKEQGDLIQLCQHLKESDVLMVDTEFVRTRTLYPKLGLLQVCNGEYLALIDPLAVEDLTPFWALIEDESIEKVIHACSEDLEVFLTQANCRPKNLIDSQIMMAFLGHGLSLGYAAMVEHFLGVIIDKSDSRTDWLKRPLTASQISYAQADVDFLYQLYPTLKSQLLATPWFEAAKQETELMIERKFTPTDTSQLYRHIKMSWRLGAKQLNLLQYLALWRLDQAQKRDMPIGFIAKDPTLIGLAKHNPSSLSAMSNIEGVDTLDIRHKGKAMLSVLQKANEVSENDYPETIVRLDEYPGYKQLFKKIKSFIADIASQHEQTVENLASKKQINQFLTWHFKLKGENIQQEQVDILRNWRMKLFGEQLLELAKDDFSRME
ncbi:ribonuclease D [Thalassotalea profundi]|uniref:Ribonuclease D n=1 Tax=Thalassotalea profundi TaxID=2036687 RepID=A0ABQ3ICN2_9GAMM|nr:ribonuclease D [Thalassotalea profundi]GHE79212.1 ribonuclease D [Thalassotalea profundi]